MSTSPATVVTKPEPDQSPEALKRDLAGVPAERKYRAPKMQLFAALRRQHPDYLRSHKRWTLLRALAAGGEQAEAVKLDLLCNPDGRSPKIQKARAAIAPLVNKVGPIIARFTTQLFVDTPNIEGTTKPWLQKFLDVGARLPDDPDQRAGFTKFLDQAMFAALAEGQAIAQIDTRTASGARFLAGQAQSGELDPYVVLLNRDCLWDWETGDQGLNMVKLHRFNTYRSDWVDRPKPEHIFTIFERLDRRVVVSQYRVRRVPTRPDEVIEPKEFIHQDWKETEITIEPVVLADGTSLEQAEIFNRRGEYEFPVVILSLPGFLCLGDQLFDLQKEHFNNRCGMNWAIQRANFAMPYVKGPRDIFQDMKVGDGYYLFIPEEVAGETTVGDFAINSPAIGSATQKEESISKDIYETLQQMAYLASQTPAAMARSEESRLKDKELEQVLLSRQGRILKEFALQIVKVAAIAAGDPVDLGNLKIDGLEKFQTSGLLSYLPLYAGLAQIGGVPTPEFKRQQFKDMTRLYGTTLDSESETVQEILDAIDKVSDEDIMAAGQPPAPEPGQPAPAG